MSLFAVAPQSAAARLAADPVGMAALPRDVVVAVGDAQAKCVGPVVLIPNNLVTGNGHPRDHNTRNLRDRNEMK